MGDIVFNIAKGRHVELVNRVKNNDPANSALVVVLLQAAEADATLLDYDDLQTLLAAAGNTEANFTNYARKVLTDAELPAQSPDDVNDRYDAGAPASVTWTAAGGASNNTLVKAIVCYDADTTGGTDANLVPVYCYDYAPTTNGNDLILNFNAAGFGRAS